MRRVFVVIAGLALACASAVASVAPASASASRAQGTTRTVGPRPASVPAGYVLTPDGYFDPHCVYQVGADQALVPDGGSTAIVTIPAHAAAAATSMATHRRAGQSTAHPAYSLTARQIAAAPRVAACTHPRYDLNGRPVAPGSQRTAPASGNPTTSGWVEFGDSPTQSPVSYLSGVWGAPPDPTTTADGQVVYFFPGIENSSGSPTIIMQPVLGWNQADSGISSWSMASWNCCSVGNVYHSSYIPVTEGDSLSGYVSGTGCSSSTDLCSNWTIVSDDLTTNQSVTLNTTSGGLVMDWLFGGVLEAYYVSQCSDYPGTSAGFGRFQVDDINGNSVPPPTWQAVPANFGITPSCNYNVTVPFNDDVILDY